MAWKETKVEEQRRQFIELHIENKLTVSELCRQFNMKKLLFVNLFVPEQSSRDPFITQKTPIKL